MMNKRHSLHDVKLQPAFFEDGQQATLLRYLDPDFINRFQQDIQQQRFISGDIACQGIPELTSGREIELSGVSSRLLGKYQVIHCTHRFDRRSGFETHLKVNKADWSTQ